MMRKIYTLVAMIGMLLLPIPAMAQVNVFPQCKAGNIQTSSICSARSSTLFGAGSTWNKLLNILTYVGGAAAVLVIILAGLRYIISNGDQSQIASAKNAILYAIIGLIITLLANAIINFVLTNI